MSHFGGRETRGQLDFTARFSLSASPSVVARGILAMFRYDATATLPAIPVPTLVIAADRDRAVVPASGERLREAMPNAGLVTLAPAGHLGLLEQNETFAEAIATFSGAKVALADASLKV